jgi:hypothetical protein
MAYIGRVKYLRNCYDTYRDYIDRYILNPTNLSDDQIENIASHFRVRKSLIKKYISGLAVEHKLSPYEKAQLKAQTTCQNT